MRRLIEWKDTNGKKVSTSSSASKAPGSQSYKERFKKLMDYHIKHKEPSVVNYEIKELTDDSLYYIEHHKSKIADYVLEVKIYIGALTGAWKLQIIYNGKVTEDPVGTGWESLLDALLLTLRVPAEHTPEYKDLLVEWVDKSGKKVSTTSSVPASKTSGKSNKGRFTYLLYYMQKNASRETEQAEVVRLDDGGFTYKEHRKKATGYEYTLTVLVGYSRFDSHWKYELYMDTNLIEEKSGGGFNELVNNLYAYYNTPKPGTVEYKDLCESASFAEDFSTYETLWD